jgi:hypothetical protein
MCDVNAAPVRLTVSYAADSSQMYESCRRPFVTGALLSEKAPHQSSTGSVAKCYARCGDSPHCFRAKDPPTPNGNTNEDVLFEYNSSCATG